MARNAGKLGWSDVTPQPLWLNRRALMAGALALTAPGLLRAQAKAPAISARRFSHSGCGVTSDQPNLPAFRAITDRKSVV